MEDLHKVGAHPHFFLSALQIDHLRSNSKFLTESFSFALCPGLQFLDKIVRDIADSFRVAPERVLLSMLGKR